MREAKRQMLVKLISGIILIASVAVESRAGATSETPGSKTISVGTIDYVSVSGSSTESCLAAKADALNKLEAKKTADAALCAASGGIMHWRGSPSLSSTCKDTSSTLIGSIFDTETTWMASASQSGTCDQK